MEYFAPPPESTGGPNMQELSGWMKEMTGVMQQLKESQQQSYREMRELAARIEAAEHRFEVPTGVATPASNEFLSPAGPSPSGLGSGASSQDNKNPQESQSPPTTTGGTIKRKPMAWPEPFKGDRSRFPGWLSVIKAKLKHDADFIGSNELQFIGIYNCLGGTARRTVEPFFVRGGTSGAHNPEEFLTHLETHFLDPNRTKRATEELHRTKQRPNERFAKFYGRFERALADAEGNTWGDAPKIAFLSQGLDNRLKEALATVILPTEYKDWVSRVMTIAGNLEGLKPSLYKDVESGQQRNQETAGTDQDGDTPMTGVNSSSAQSDRKRAPWASQETLDKRRKNKECLRCGKKGHFIAECRLLPPRPPKKQDTTEVKATGSRSGKTGTTGEGDPSADEESEESEEDSENA